MGEDFLKRLKEKEKTQRLLVEAIDGLGAVKKQRNILYLRWATAVGIVLAAIFLFFDSFVPALTPLWAELKNSMPSFDAPKPTAARLEDTALTKLSQSLTQNPSQPSPGTPPPESPTQPPAPQKQGEVAQVPPPPVAATVVAPPPQAIPLPTVPATAPLPPQPAAMHLSPLPVIPLQVSAPDFQQEKSAYELTVLINPAPVPVPLRGQFEEGPSASQAAARIPAPVSGARIPTSTDYQPLATPPSALLGFENEGKLLKK